MHINSYVRVVKVKFKLIQLNKSTALACYMANATRSSEARLRHSGKNDGTVTKQPEGWRDFTLY